MNYLFPEIEQQNKKTLVVIGNGFDLANGIESSYGNFKEWLQKNVAYKDSKILYVKHCSNGFF